MASRHRRLAANAEGDFFVDDTCIDCAACRWMAPEVFDEHAGMSRVHRQPRDETARASALRALVACPTGSIGTRDKRGLAEAARAFPHPIAGGVHHCGYHSDKSFGAASYLIQRDGGNLLVDSPRYDNKLADNIEALGGVALMFLTHRDDVADHQRFQRRFGCRRVLHARDVTARTRDVEVLLRGDEPCALADDLLALPTPGHTAGSACLLYRERFLFSGDHVAYEASEDRIIAFVSACWYDWETQIRSMDRLAGYRFEHILPGHGAPCHFEADEMKRRMRACVAWMRAS
jgi:glyoxylase-like metal-dependent hydrolase (beta-lactamase superfamily II)